MLIKKKHVLVYGSKYLNFVSITFMKIREKLYRFAAEIKSPLLSPPSNKSLSPAWGAF